MPRFHSLRVIGLILAVAASLDAKPCLAAPLPGPADIERIKPAQPTHAPLTAPPEQELPVVSVPLSAVSAPEGAQKIHFILHGVTFENVTVFSTEELRNLYQTQIDKDVTLDIAWEIAAALTARYQQDGYFLSRAFVPAQDIAGGRLTIRAVEGYIGDISVTGDAPESFLIRSAVKAIKAQKPARTQTLEHQLLLLKDLPGISFQSVLEPLKNRDEAAVHLILAAQRTKAVTTLGIDNTGSRYLGPYQASAGWSGSLIPLQKTDLSAQTAPFGGKLYGVNATHVLGLSMTDSLDFTGGYSNAAPGYTLKVQDIQSRSVNGGIGISRRLVRQRDQNLTLRLATEFHNSSSDILGTVLSRDRIRIVSLGVNYDGADHWLGREYPAYGYADITLRQGLPVFNSNGTHDTDTSRLNARPDFLKLQASYTRFQKLSENGNSVFILSGQKSSESLYSSEEFGYGGAALGRAYDSSEISGDSGIAASLELRYQGLPAFHQSALTPFFFYDIGKVWNYNAGQPQKISAASSGLGLRLLHDKGLSATVYAAKPLTKRVDTPLYGGNGKTPRFVFQTSYTF
jgi:hemolysin activation/secretion protein